MASINPLGERARGNRWWRTAAALAAGCAVGGGLVGAAAGALGGLVARLAAPSPRLALVLGAAAVVAGGLVEMAGLRVPSVRRQVSEDWLTRYRGWVYGAGFGVQLGAGLATTVATGAVYCMLATALLLGAVGQGMEAVWVGVLFGLARAGPVLAGGGLHDPERLRRRLRRLAEAAGASRVAAGSSLCVLGAWTLATGGAA